MRDDESHVQNTLVVPLGGEERLCVPHPYSTLSPLQLASLGPQYSPEYTLHRTHIQAALTPSG